MLPDEVLSALTAVVGPAGLKTGPSAVEYGVDTRGRGSSPGPSEPAVVLPSSTHQVAKIVQLCKHSGVALVCQGGNTGLSRGQIPSQATPVLVLSLRRMNRIIEVNKQSWTMTVEAGAQIQALQQSAALHDRKFAPDWGARGTATIGGAISTDAGGINVVRYGNMREQVLGLEAVLGTGDIWDGLRSLRKDSSGYDIKQLLIGAEGTLGVITRAVVKLVGPTPHVQSMLMALPELSAVSEVFSTVREVTSESMTAFELVPEFGLKRACRLLERARPIAHVSEFYALVQFASGDPLAHLVTAVLEQLSAANLIVDAVVASTAAQEAELWMIRDELTPLRLFPDSYNAGLKLDTAVPIDKIAYFHDRVCDIAAKMIPGAVAYGFGHIGDGNIHMMILPGDAVDIDEFNEHKDELESSIDELTFSLKGTLSAEHGVGRDLVHRVKGQKSKLEWDLMRALKDVFDPAGIMNPGVIFGSSPS